MSEQSILHIDAAPDKTYPIRILRAYRALCDTRWASTTNTNSIRSPNAFVQMMNDLQDKRAVLLDEAIRTLEAAFIGRETK